MTKSTYQAQVLSIAQADHEVLEFGIKTFRKLFQSVHPVDAGEFANLPQLIVEKLNQHFAYEEKFVFPALLADPAGEKTTQVIAELRQEHVILLEESRRLKTMLHRHAQGKPPDELRTAMLVFFTDLEKHASKEEKLFEGFN